MCRKGYAGGHKLRGRICSKIKVDKTTGTCQPDNHAGGQWRSCADLGIIQDGILLPDLPFPEFWYEGSNTCNEADRKRLHGYRFGGRRDIYLPDGGRARNACQREKHGSVRKDRYDQCKHPHAVFGTGNECVPVRNDRTSGDTGMEQ